MKINGCNDEEWRSFLLVIEQFLAYFHELFLLVEYFKVTLFDSLNSQVVTISHTHTHTHTHTYTQGFSVIAN